MIAKSQQEESVFLRVPIVNFFFGLWEIYCFMDSRYGRITIIVVSHDHDGQASPSKRSYILTVKYPS